MVLAGKQTMKFLLILNIQCQISDTPYDIYIGNVNLKAIEN